MRACVRAPRPVHLHRDRCGGVLGRRRLGLDTHALRLASLSCARPDLRYFQSRLNPALLSTLEATVAAPFARITYTEAIALLERAPKKARFEFKPFWEAGLQSEHEKYLAEVVFNKSVTRILLHTGTGTGFGIHPLRLVLFFFVWLVVCSFGLLRCTVSRASLVARAHCFFCLVFVFCIVPLLRVLASPRRPVFITHYPRASKPFYMRADEASLATPGRETVRCFDLIIPGVGELIGGSEREERYEQLLSVAWDTSTRAAACSIDSIEPRPLACRMLTLVLARVLLRFSLTCHQRQHAPPQA